MPKMTEVFKVREGLWDRLTGKGPKPGSTQQAQPQQTQQELPAEIPDEEIAKLSQDQLMNLQWTKGLHDRNPEYYMKLKKAYDAKRWPEDKSQADKGDPDVLSYGGGTEPVIRKGERYGHSSSGNTYRKDDDDGNMRNAF